MVACLRSAKISFRLAELTRFSAPLNRGDGNDTDAAETDRLQIKVKIPTELPGIEPSSQE